MGVSNTNGCCNGKRLAAIGYRGSQFSGRSRGNIGISFTGNHRILSHMSRHIAMRLCPAEINGCTQDIYEVKLRHLQRDFIIS